MELIKLVVRGILYPIVLFLILGLARISGKRELDTTETITFVLGIMSMLMWGGFLI